MHSITYTLTVGLLFIGCQSLYIKRQMDPDNMDRYPDDWVNEDREVEERNILQRIIADNNVAGSGGLLYGGSYTNPNSGRILTTTSFPRITIFDDHRDGLLHNHIQRALPKLADIIRLYHLYSGGNLVSGDEALRMAMCLRQNVPHTKPKLYEELTEAYCHFGYTQTHIADATINNSSLVSRFQSDLNEMICLIMPTNCTIICPVNILPLHEIYGVQHDYQNVLQNVKTTLRCLAMYGRRIDDDSRSKK